MVVALVQGDVQGPTGITKARGGGQQQPRHGRSDEFRSVASTARCGPVVSGERGARKQQTIYCVTALSDIFGLHTDFVSSGSLHSSSSSSPFRVTLCFPLLSNLSSSSMPWRIGWHILSRAKATVTRRADMRQVGITPFIPAHANRFRINASRHKFTAPFVKPGCTSCDMHLSDRRTLIPRTRGLMSMHMRAFEKLAVQYKSSTYLARPPDRVCL